MRFAHYFFSLLVVGFLLTGCKSKKSAIDHSSLNDGWEPTAKSLLWKVQKPGHKDSYVYGTIHLIEREHFFYPKGTEEALVSAQRIVYEIDLEEMLDPANQMSLLTKAFMKDEVRISDLLSDDDYEIVSKHFEHMGMPMMFIDRIKPMFLSVMVGQDFEMEFLGEGDMMSYEIELDKLATEANLLKSGLETIDYQLELFDAIPYEAQAKMLVDAIRQLDDVSDNTLELYAEMYTSQDIKRMHDFTVSDDGGVENYTELLLYTRNNNWIPLMEEMMKNESVFFAVGAGHLGGKKGVLALLWQRGFSLEPM